MPFCTMKQADALGVPTLSVSYKPQKISPKFQGTVRQLLHTKIRDAYVHPQFVTDVMRPLNVEDIIDNEVQVSFHTLYYAYMHYTMCYMMNMTSTCICIHTSLQRV
jgi:hypothetical protein